ncbi:MAG: helix-turn-helix domain-containing protein [Proteobacteria bacterium]|nr:helix-turn-helix domain-containing protein [Pseudomonadota bacterium]
MDYLVLIEKEDHDRLPAAVFVMGFMRAYAQVIGADGEEAVQRYRASRQIFQEAAGFDADLKRSGQAFWPRLLLALGILLGIIVMSVLVLSALSKRPVQDESKPKIVEKKPHNFSAEENRAPDSIKKPSEYVAHNLLLKIDTVDDTWIKIIIDSQSPKEYSLRPGDLLELEASSGFNLLIGNAAGVQLTVNGKPVRVSGKSGQIVNVQIP